MAGQPETAILRDIRLALSRAGRTSNVVQDIITWRNNQGLAWYGPARDQPVRYGLAPGSADLIGLVSRTVTPDMVGQVVALFMAIEVKTATGRLSADQKTFLRVVAEKGGVAGVARSAEEAVSLVFPPG